MAGLGNRNADWKSAIDSYVSGGGQLGLSYLQGLSSQYNVPYDTIVGFINKNGYKMGAKAAAAASTPTQTAPAFNPGNYDSFKLSGVSGLTDYLNSLNGKTLSGNALSIMAGHAGAYKPVLKMLSNYMGVKNINSKSEIKQALSILGGANNSLAQAISPRAGIKSYDSLNDYLKVLGGGVGRSTSAATNPGQGAGMGTAAGGGAGKDTAAMDSGYSYKPETITDPTPPQYTPGGGNAALDGGATGMRARRSKWRTTGKTSKGTSNLKIMGQTGSSSGINTATSAAAGMAGSLLRP